ncbi:hypothetical protein MKX03_013501, partial [Papaver bracteatum]
MSKPNAKISSGGSKDSHVYEFKTKETVMNVNDVEEGEGWGCLEERESQHESSSQAHLKMNKKIFGNLVSDSDDD